MVRVPVVASGTYYLIFVTDGYNDLYESDENNNVSVAVPVTFDLWPPPDLAPIALQSPLVVTGAPNSGVTVIWGVTNQGAGPAVASWVDGVYLSTTPVLDWPAWTICYQNETNTVAAGGSYWRTNVVPVPEVPSGTYYLIFKTDTYDYLYESNETNNMWVVPVTYTNLLPPPDLAPVALQVPTVVTGPPNPSVTLVWGVTNESAGPAWGYWYDAVYLSTDAVLDGWDDWLVSDSYETNTVVAAGSYWRTNTMRVPVVESGTYYLIFQVNDWGYLYESDWDNNVFAVPVMFNIITPPILRIGDGQFPSDGGFRLAVYGEIGSDYTLQASTNLVDWVSIFNFSCTNSPTYVVDPGAKYFGWRFYRIAQGTLPVLVKLRLGTPAFTTTNGLRLNLEGPLGFSYTIQASTNLLNWQPLTNFVGAQSPFYFSDPGTTNYDRRFYRAVVP
jgi:hypothetical protein